MLWSRRARRDRPSIGAADPCIRRELPDILKPPLRRLFPNALICEFYGTSEHSYITYARDGETPSGSVGKPFSGIAVQIRDAAGDALPVGGVGRIFVESPLLFDGYELADNPTLERDGDALFVGDLGYLDEEGFLFLTGRSDRMFVSSGKNIYPEELEEVVAAHPSVKYACAMGIEDTRRGQRPVALLQLESGRDCLSRELKACVARGCLCIRSLHNSIKSMIGL